MTGENQAVYLNGVPLIVLAALYLGVSVAITPSFVRRRAGATLADWARALVFPCIGASCALVGAGVLVDREPVGGNVWLSFAAFLLAAVPALLFAVRLGDRSASAGTRRASSTVSGRCGSRRLSRIAGLLGEPVSMTATLDAVAQAAAEAFGGDYAAVVMPRHRGLPSRRRARPARGAARPPSRTDCPAAPRCSRT